MLKVYGRHTSYNVQKVLWLLAELNMDYDHIQAGGQYGSTESAEFMTLNPFGKIPVLVDGDKKIRESNTILRYLVDSYGKCHWKTTDPYQRARYEAWMDWSIDRFEPAFVRVFWGYYRTPAAKRNLEQVNAGIASCQDCLLQIEQALKRNDYLVGDRLSLADISVGVFLYRLLNLELAIELVGRTKRWYKLLQRSTGYQTWVMSDFSELAGREHY